MLYKRETIAILIDRATAKAPAIRRKRLLKIAVCPECYSDLYDCQAYCDRCGQRIKWEENEG